MIAAKIQSAKRVLQRRLRNHGEHEEIQAAVTALNFSLQQLKRVQNLDLIRDIEGDAAARVLKPPSHPRVPPCNSRAASRGCVLKPNERD